MKITFNDLTSDYMDTLSSPDEVITEATQIQKLPYMKTVTKKIDFPIGKPAGRGNVCYLYTHNLKESKEIMSNTSKFRNAKTYKMYYYHYYYSGKVYNKVVRIRESKNQKEIYEKLKQELNIIGRRRLVNTEGNNRNMYFELCKYLEIFSSICYKLQPKMYIKLFWEYLKPIITKPIPGYNTKFIIVNLAHYNLDMSNIRKNLDNPLYLIYYTMYTNPSLLTDFNIDFIFYFNTRFLKINPSIIDVKKGYKRIKIEMSKIYAGNAKRLQVVSKVTDETELNKAEITATTTSEILSKIEVNDSNETIKNMTMLKAVATPTADEKEVETKVKAKVDNAVKNAVVKDSINRNNDNAVDKKISDNAKKEVSSNVQDEVNKERETLEKIYRNNNSSAEKQKSAASTARDNMLREQEKDIKIKGMRLEDIQKIKAEDIPVESRDISKSLKTTNDHMKEVRFDNLDQQYNDKLMTKDITSSILSLNDKSIPMYIRKIEVKDTSDELNYKETYTIYLEDGNRKRHTVTVDIPKLLDGHFIYIGGNKKIIKHQNFLLPIVKISPDSVQIVTNYSKLTLNRIDNKSTSGVERLKKLIRTYPEVQKCFTNGSVYPNNAKYLTVLEYDALSKTYASFRSKSTYLIFDQAYAHKYMEKHNISAEKGKIFIGMIGKDPCFIDANTQVDKDNRSIIDIIMDALPEKIQEEYGAIKAPKRLVYSSVRIMGQNMYLGMLLGFWISLSKLLKLLKVKYRIEKRIPKDMTGEENFIKFADGILVYSCDVPAALIMNSIKLFNTQNYNIASFDEQEPYLDYIKKVYGKAIIENALMNFYEFLLDPITLEICQTMNLPTTVEGIIIYGVNLLADTQSQNELNQNLSRIRCTEVIPGILYENLARYYVDYRTSGGRKKYNVPRDCVIKDLLALKTVEDYSTLNPTLEMLQFHAVSNKGFRGINTDDYYTIERRAYDPTMMGILSPSGSPDGNVGVNKTLSLEPKITNLRGIIEDNHKHLNKLDDVNLFGPGELTMPLAGTIDDPNRLGHANKQSSHVVPVKNSAPVLISNGMEEAARFHVSSSFAINADEPGEIVAYDKSTNIMIAKYKSGKCRAIDLNPNIVKNAGGGFYLSNKLITDLKVGDKFKKDAVLAYHKDFFTNDKYNDCRMNMGTLTKIAIMSTYNTYEDSTFITHKLSEDCATEMVFQKSVSVGKNSNVFNIVKVGQEVEVGDPLITFDTSYDDDSINTLLSNLAEEEKNSIMEDAKNEIKSKYSGVIEDIKIFPTVDLEEMSPSLKKIVSSYYYKIDKKKRFLDKYDPDAKSSVVKCGILVNEPSHKVQPNKYGVIRGEHVEDAVLFEFYIKHSEPLEVGSKIANFTALKNTIGEILPEGYEPYSEYRRDEEIGTFVASNSILSRMTPSILLTALGNKCIIELKRHLKDIYPNRKKMEKLIYDFFSAIDPSGSNTQKYKTLFEPMSDASFKNYFNGLFKDDKAYLILDIVDYEHTIKMKYIEKAAKVLNIPLYETVFLPHLTMDKNNVVSTKEPVPVGYINEKRTQQTMKVNKIYVCLIHISLWFLNSFNCWNILRVLSTKV